MRDVVTVKATIIDMPNNSMKSSDLGPWDLRQCYLNKYTDEPCNPDSKPLRIKNSNICHICLKDYNGTSNKIGSLQFPHVTPGTTDQ